MSITQSPYMTMFETFRSELDEHHDRRERIIKISRDVTAQSKKIIFSLQRIRPPIPTALAKPIASDVNSRHETITKLLNEAAVDLTSLSGWRYQRQISPGLQEYVEALTFEHYLTTQTLLTLSEARSKLPNGIMLTEEDYVLGIFDLTGEVMRFAVTGIAMGSLGGFQRSGAKSSGNNQVTGTETGMGTGKKRETVDDLRELRAHLEALDGSTRKVPMGREFGKKMDVMRTCVEKVEGAMYGMIVRGRERPKGWVPELGGGGGGGGAGGGGGQQQEVESY
ncbi:hypothetical protein MMC25_002799 [Agyrium rufum]|nr:hypothetical protein [Agyrium rufum]